MISLSRHSIRFDSTRFDSIRFDSFRFDSIRFDSIRFLFVSFHAIPFDSIPWQAIYVMIPDALRRYENLLPPLDDERRVALFVHLDRRLSTSMDEHKRRSPLRAEVRRSFFSVRHDVSRADIVCRATPQHDGASPHRGRAPYRHVESWRLVCGSRRLIDKFHSLQR